MYRRGAILLVLSTVVAAWVAEPRVAGGPAFRDADFVVPMDDGARIYGWVRYAEPLRPRPVVLTVTPYGPPVGSGAASAWLPLLGQDDFAFVTVHQRGVGASEGFFDGWGPRTKQDAYQIVDYVARQPWSNGRVMAFGISAPGIGVQDVAISGHPAVKAGFLVSTLFDFYREAWDGGVSWPKAAYLHYPFAHVNLFNATNLEARQRFGLRMDIIPQQLASVHLFWFEAYRLRSLDSKWWRDRSFYEEAPDVRIPMLLNMGSRDLIRPHDMILAFKRYGNAWLNLGWGHEGPPVLSNEYGVPWAIRFARHFLLEEDNGWDQEPRILLPIQLGSRTGYLRSQVLLRGEGDWPLPGTRWTRLYLRSGRSGSAASLNDGSLSLTPPAAEGPDVVATGTGAGPLGPYHDPHFTNVVPFAVLMQQGGESVSAVDPLAEQAADLRPAEVASLTYTTPPFKSNVEVSGPLSLRIFASSTVPDFVWAVRVTDVWPDGRSMWLADTELRASMRRVDSDRSLKSDSGEIVSPFYVFDERQPLFPREIVEYLLDAGDISNVFAAGHRLRVDLVGLGPADVDVAPGSVTVYHDAEHPSSVLLPVVPGRCGLAKPAVEGLVHPGECVHGIEEAVP